MLAANVLEAELDELPNRKLGRHLRPITLVAEVGNGSVVQICDRERRSLAVGLCDAMNHGDGVGISADPVREKGSGCVEEHGNDEEASRNKELGALVHL